jgi:hypothetical protein
MNTSNVSDFAPSSNFGAFATPLQQQACEGFDSFGGKVSQGFESFASHSGASTTFDPFSNGSNYSIQAFPSASINQVEVPTPSSMPFLQINPVKLPEPTPIVNPTVPQGGFAKNLSAFDDLVQSAPVPGLAPSQTGNPFDAPSPVNSLQQYGTLPGYPHPQGQGSYGPSGFPQGAFISQTSFGGPPVHAQGQYAQYASPQIHQNVSGYPIQMNSYGTQHVHHIAQQSNMPYDHSNAGYGSVPLRATSGSSFVDPSTKLPEHRIAFQHPQQHEPAIITNPDPFSAMGSNAWSSVGGKPKALSTSTFGSDAVLASDQNLGNPFESTSSSSSVSVAQNVPPASAASVNPFDMF